MPRRRFLQLAGAGLGAAALHLPAPAHAARPSRRRKKLILLGIDAMDPHLLRRYVREGRMPHTARLLAQAGFRELATSNPALSPVAWANVISGTNPGGHGIFDFFTRDPATLLPRFSMATTAESPRLLSTGPWAIPLAPAELRNMREGPVFWNLLEQQDVPCTVLRMPTNFPPTPSNARTLSGLGTPDIHGSYGIFTQYTDAARTTHSVSGGRIERVRIRQGQAACVLRGPANTLRQDRRPVDIPFQVSVDAERGAARIRIQDADLLLQTGEWSDWIRVRFRLMPLVAHVSAICRFYLQRVRDGFSLYVTPLNMDPRDPSMPISTPPQYARELAQAIGPFYTQGMAQDTSACRAGVLDDDEFRHQSIAVLEEEERMHRHALDQFHEGCYFAYFSSLDLNGHIFWRTLDPLHPLYTDALARRHGDVMPWLYARMDALIGDALQRCDADTTLMVMSDHGFYSFRRQFNLNAWLMDEGYATSLDPAARGVADFLGEVDWPRTRAYGLGMNGLYLNLAGRERDGVVRPGTQREALLQELTERLEALRDPVNGAPAVSRVYRADAIYTGPAAAGAPDLVIGYGRHYRGSWDTVLGRFPRDQFLDNTDAWSGDHAMNPPDIPGVLLSSRPIASNQPALQDMAPSFLQHFDVPVPPTMTGSSVFTS